MKSSHSFALPDLTRQDLEDAALVITPPRGVRVTDDGTVFVVDDGWAEWWFTPAARGVEMRKDQNEPVWGNPNMRPDPAMLVPHIQMLAEIARELIRTDAAGRAVACLPFATVDDFIGDSGQQALHGAWTRVTSLSSGAEIWLRGMGVRLKKNGVVLGEWRVIRDTQSGQLRARRDYELREAALPDDADARVLSEFLITIAKNSQAPDDKAG